MEEADDQTISCKPHSIGIPCVMTKEETDDEEFRVAAVFGSSGIQPLKFGRD